MSRPRPRPTALQSLHDGSREREQEILTPAEIVRVALTVWPEGIALDPCDDSCLPRYNEDTGEIVLPEAVSLISAEVHYDSLDSGLDLPWLPRTFVNPPYRDLEEWLAKGDAAPDELLMLGPVRTHRKWWRRYLRSYDRVAWLDPPRFVGFDSGFPAPLFLAYRGARIAVFEEAVAAGCLGDVGRFT